MTKKAVWPLTAALATTLALSACGGSEPTTTDAAPATTASATTPTTAAPVTTTQAPPPTTEAPAPTTTAAPEPTAPPTEAPTTTIDPIATAGQYYLEHVRGLNCAWELEMLAAADSTSRFGDTIYEGEFNEYRQFMMPTWEMKRDAELTWMQALIDYEWPSEVQPAIDDVIAQAAGQAAAYEALTTMGFHQWVTYVWPTTTENPAAVARAILGLPSNINTDVNACREIADSLPTTTAAP